MEPKRPSLISEYVEHCLDALSDSPLAGKISIGGAVGLMHYHAYRVTYDVDAWWEANTTSQEKQLVIELISKTLQKFGDVKTRAWGDVTSIELSTDNAKVFSFQIADRTVQLEPSLSSPWPGIKVDSLDDLVASKMVALVERGAPRDFLDIYTICQNNIITAESCWQLWQKRQTKSGHEVETDRAELALQTHLARIEQHRPLHLITHWKDRQQAESVRNWFKKDFLEALWNL